MPTANYNGADSFTFKVNDGAGDSSGDSSAATASITVTAVNDAPSATALSFSTNEDSTYASNGSSRAHLSGSDVEASSLTCAKVSDPSHGAVTVNSDCSFSYVPTANYNGADSFTFKVNDGAGDSSAATASITVVSQSPTPVITGPGSVTTSVDTAVSVTLAATDPNGDALTYTVTSSPVGGTLSGTAPNLTYTPLNDWAGSDSFQFSVSDGANTATGSVSITVTDTFRDAPDLLTISYSSTSINAGTSMNFLCDFGDITTSLSRAIGATLTNNSKFKMVIRAMSLHVSTTCQSGSTCSGSNGSVVSIELNPGQSKTTTLANAPYSITQALDTQKTFTSIHNVRYVVNVLRDPGAYLAMAGAADRNSSSWRWLFLQNGQAFSSSDNKVKFSPEIYYRSVDINSNVTITGTNLLGSSCGNGD